MAQTRALPVRFARLLAVALAVIPVGRAWAMTICLAPCGTNIETRQYAYSGYLKDLAVLSSRTLPFTLSDFFQATDTAPGSLVPVQVSLRVQQSQDFVGTSLGTPSYDYWYSVSMGRLSVSGAVVNPYEIGYLPSPFQDGGSTNGLPTDSLTVENAGFNAAIAQSNLALRSRGGRFFLTMQDQSGQALDSNFPASNAALESLFPGGQFHLTGDLAVYDHNGNIILPLSDSDFFMLTGSFSSAAAAFAPSSTTIGSPVVLAPGPFPYPIPITPAPLPAPPTLALIGLGLVGIGAIRRKKKGRNS